MQEEHKDTYPNVEDGRYAKSVSRQDSVARHDTVANTVAKATAAKPEFIVHLMEGRVGPKLLMEESMQEPVFLWEVGIIMRNIALRQLISWDSF